MSDDWPKSSRLPSSSRTWGRTRHRLAGIAAELKNGTRKRGWRNIVGENGRKKGKHDAKGRERRKKRN